MKTRLIIGADLVPTESNWDAFIKGDADHLIGDELQQTLRSADYIVMNLEVPLTDQLQKIRKCGPSLHAPTETIRGIRKINPFFFTLANNHIMDQDEQGLLSTMECLKAQGIAFAGAGKTPEDARKPHIVRVNDLSIGIICVAEHEFSIVTDKRAGANPYDPLVSFDDVSLLKKQTDFVIVLYHGGKEHYRYPSPQMQRVFRKFADAGADVVVAQHSHCIGCMEKYKESTLVYGQGNFLLDRTDNIECWKTSLLLNILINDEKQYSLDLIPCVKQKETVRLASADEQEAILKQFSDRSEEITTPGRINERYQ